MPGRKPSARLYLKMASSETELATFTDAPFPRALTVELRTTASVLSPSTLTPVFTPTAAVPAPVRPPR